MVKANGKSEFTAKPNTEHGVSFTLPLTVKPIKSMPLLSLPRMFMIPWKPKVCSLKIPVIAAVAGDKGYDNKNAYEPIAKRHAKAIIPPRSGAALKLKNPTWGDLERNRLVREQHLIGKKTWKKASGCIRCVLVETGIERYNHNSPSAPSDSTSR